MSDLQSSLAGRLKKFLPLLLAVMLMATAGYQAGVYGSLRFFGLGPSDVDKEIVVARGAAVLDIARQLEQDGLVYDATSFAVLAQLGNHFDPIKAGEYLIPATSSAARILSILREGVTIQRKLTVPEGLTSYQIVQMLKENPYLQGEIATIPAEGTLLPETYNFQRNDTRAAVLARMTEAMEKMQTALWATRDTAAVPLKTVTEAITLASIVEKETGVAAERPRIAGVFYNRLAKGMPLQSDPTTIYALTGGRGSIQEVMGRQLTRADWALENPYNTYHVKGLPPGPIANIGRAALEAVLKPEKNDYIFFVADGSGGHVFAATYAEHLANIDKRLGK